HRIPAVTGKPAHWLLDVVCNAATGGGQTDQWALSPLHRTLAQTSSRHEGAPAQLARLLAQLDATDTAGLITTHTATSDEDAGAIGPGSATAAVRFRFGPFRAAEPGRRYDPEYL
ncbi:MAG: hypothetical protein J2P19_28490, partial [Pseudonocardia sp.]|nr:hypothetical protein [Pseudonocardia sp.]